MHTGNLRSNCMTCHVAIAVLYNVNDNYIISLSIIFRPLPIIKF